MHAEVSSHLLVFYTISFIRMGKEVPQRFDVGDPGRAEPPTDFLVIDQPKGTSTLNREIGLPPTSYPGFEARTWRQEGD